MNIQSFFKNNWMHFAVLAVFIAVTVFYFSPEFDGYSLKQHDVEQHKGMSNEIAHFREMTDGQEPLWTNSMFGGMPAIQISTLYNGNIFQKAIISFLGAVGVPAGIFLLHLICFYILALCIRVKPIIAVFGALAFALASYEIVILQAGHNSKAIAMAFMAPVLGAFIMAYRNNWKWGVLLSGFFMTWELAANHLQVTYYLGILLFFLGIYELVNAVREKKIKQFSFTSLGIVGGYLLALMINYGNITLTNDYAKYSIRGAQDLTINPEGEEAKNPTDGLDKDYITNWSYGVSESFTLLSPYVKGSHSAPLSSTHFVDLADQGDLTGAERKGALDMPVYWGEQPMTSGPVYLGIISVFLALLALFFVKDRSKWVIFGVSILALMLSWGKNFMGLTDFFIDNVPGYGKFRTVTIILVLIELCVPVLAIYTLQKLYDSRETIKQEKKKFLMASGGFFAFLVVVKFLGLGDNYVSEADFTRLDSYRENITEQVMSMDPAVLSQQYGVDVNNMASVSQFVDAQMENVETGFEGIKKVRSSIFQSSMNRSIGIGLLGIILTSLFFFTAIPNPIIIGGLILISLIDWVTVDRNYLGSETMANGNYKHWVPEPEALFPISSTTADEAILQNEITEHPELQALVDKGIKQGQAKADEMGYAGRDKRRVVDSYKFSALNMNTNFRVFDYNGGWGSARASYFHKSLGGYHGAKLRNIQNVFEFHIAKGNNKIFDMLNVKYFIQGDNIRPNPTAMGNAWFVQEVISCKSPNDEIRALGAEFKLVNVGEGKLLVNDVAKATADVFGGERLKYLLSSGDTLDVPLTNGLRPGLKAVFVMDRNSETNLVPEQTLILDTANSFRKLVEMEMTKQFDPSKSAVVSESNIKALNAQSFTGEGEIKMTSYAPNKIEYNAEAKGNQLAVFSEIYYPEGWTATVDGKPADILKVDYLLRGLNLTSGKHKIVFTFDLPKLKTSNTMAVAGTLVLGFALVFGIWKFRKEDEIKPENEAK